MQQRSKALVTLVVGAKYIDAWKKWCEPNWRDYAQRFGYDLICLDRALDNTERARNRSVSWQKCIVLDQDFAQKYERVVWLDADIIINNAVSPDIVDGVPLEKVGAVDAFSIPSRQLCIDSLERCFEYWESAGGEVIWETTPQEYHSNYGFPPAMHNAVVQCGVMVLSPHHHRQLLSTTYYQYEDKGGARWHYEARPLSWELLNADVVHWIDYRFNALWILFRALHYPFLLTRPPRFSKARVLRKLMRKIAGDRIRRIKQACVNGALLNSYFMHFGAAMEDMPLANPALTNWRQCVL